MKKPTILQEIGYFLLAAVLIAIGYLTTGM
jgi:hypothetical protein